MPKGVYKRDPSVRLGPKPSIGPDCDKLIARLYKAGWSVREICEDLDLGGKTVGNSLKRTKTRKRPKGNHGEKNGSWKGGRVLRKGGYICIRKNGKYVAEHRLVMEQIIGRPLKKKEVVHHINGNPADNRPENLALFADNATHLAVELDGKCPNWTEDGLRRIAEGAKNIPSPKGIPVIRTGRADAQRSRKKMISQLKHEISEQEHIEQGAEPIQLPPLPPRSKIEHGKEHPSSNDL